MAKNHLDLPVKDDLVIGADSGGTKVHVLDNQSGQPHTYSTKDFADLDSLLDKHFATIGAVPRSMVIAMAGPRDDQTGAIKMTNCPWPTFYPKKSEERFPGTNLDTANDMEAVAAGIASASSTDVIQIKPGKESPTGTKLAVTISTGIGACAAVWDPLAKRRVFMPTEAGHAGFMPYDEAQRRHLAYIFTKRNNPSFELALAGKFGIPAWAEHNPDLEHAPKLNDALKQAEQSGQPVGMVLLAFATEGQGKDQEVAKNILNDIANLVGNMLADFALLYKTTGGIYLTGSISMALAEYWAKSTSMIEAFERTELTEHSPWLEAYMKSVPIYLSTDPYVAVKGALALAKSRA